MRSAVPWSVKGIEPEAREAAKQAARRAGVTLGAWLNQIIMDGGTDEVDAPQVEIPLTTNSRNPSSLFAGQPVFSHAVDMAPVADAVREIVNRVEQSERRASDLARRLEQSVGQLAERVDHSERTQSERGAGSPIADRQVLDPLERKIQQLSERLEDAERKRATFARKADDNSQIQTLEKAVNAVVDHLEAAERRTDDALHDIRRALNDVASRVERERSGAGDEALVWAQKLERNFHSLTDRLEKTEQSITGIASYAVEAALRALAEKKDADEEATTEQLQHTLDDITHRLERAESRTNETLRTFEMSVSGIARRLEELDSRKDEPQVEMRLEDLAGRLNKTEDMTLQAAQAIERAIAGMSDSMHISESRSRETIGSLHVMLERMTDRLGRIERDAKAQGLADMTPAMLRPQAAAAPVMQAIAPEIAQEEPTLVEAALSPVVTERPLTPPAPPASTALPMGASGFVPGGQAFPIPNFDAPSLNSAGNAFAGPASMNPFGETATTDAFADDAQQPTPPASSFDTEMAPPFAAPAGDDGRREPKLDMGVADATPEIDNPTQETAQAANEFLAAARRAAQAAATNGRAPQQTLGAGFSDPSGLNFAAGMSDEKRRKIMIGLVAAVLAVAVAIGASRFMKSEPAVVAIAPATQTSIAPAQTTAVTVPETQTPIRREASAEDIGAHDMPADIASTVPAVEAKKPDATLPRVDEKLPAAAAAPETPVTRAPLNDAPTDRTLRAAASEGNAAAQYEVAQRYATGENMTQDLKQAAYWYNESANQGLAIAQYRLAVLYEKGRGVAQDTAQARNWYQKAATQGNVKAMHNLAVIYAEGRGTKQDFATAARWFAQAAEYGLGDSQYNLGILQERGLGVKQDLASAYKWFSIGATGGDKGAQQKRDELAGRVDAATLAKGKTAAQLWSAKRAEPMANGDLSTMGNWKNAGADTSASLAGSSVAGLAGASH